MKQVSKILKITGKDFIKSYLSAVLVALLGGIALVFATINDFGSFKSSYLFASVSLVIVVTLIFTFISVLTSIDKTYTMASKFGFTRKEISYSLLIKDIILLIIISLITFGLSHIFVGQLGYMTNLDDYILDFFVDGKPSFFAIFREVLMIINFAMIASILAFMIGFPPGPIVIILYVIFTAIINNNITNNPIYIFIALIIFAIAVIFRHIVIKKFDPKK